MTASETKQSTPRPSYLTAILMDILSEEQAKALLKCYKIDTLNIDTETWENLSVYRKLSYSVINGRIDMSSIIITPQGQPSTPKTTPPKLKPTTLPPTKNEQQNSSEII